MTTDPYLDAGSGLLANLPGITDASKWSEADRRISGIRLSELMVRHVPGVYDLDHFRRFHKLIFRDLFAWAGSLRTVRIEKGDTVFCLPQFIEIEGTRVFAELSAVVLQHDADTAAARISRLYSEVNVLHPFREGNGRTQRAFFRQWALSQGWRMNWSLVEAEANIEASRAAYRGDLNPLTSLIRSILESPSD